MSKPSEIQGSGNINVVCRVRPFNTSEKEMGSIPSVEFIDQQSIRLKLSSASEGNSKDSSNSSSNSSSNATTKQVFNFDRVFNMETSQESIYEFAAKPVVLSVLEGFNGTVFAYGQTSSGKTFTMQGASIDDAKLKGVIPRMVKTVFQHISDSPDHLEFRIKISIVEIYMEKIKDLLDSNKTNLAIREDKARGVYIQDVTEEYVSTEQDVFDLMRVGNSNRAVQSTNMNEGSSRSHMIFMLTVAQNNLQDLSAKTGKLFLVDLAGSEKVGKTGAEGKVLDEAKTINQSLSSLGNVINALTDGKSTHVPYRNSKLTRVLQESIGGNSRTTLIITCSPSAYNDLETLSTLRFGIRAKAIKNRAKINREITVAELQILLAKTEKELELAKTKIISLEELALANNFQVPVMSMNHGSSAPTTPKKGVVDIDEDSQIEDQTNHLKSFNNMQLKQLEEELDVERANVTVQLEKINVLRKELTKMNTKCLNFEKENENLVTRLANLALEFEEEKHVFVQKEKEFEEKSIEFIVSKEQLEIELQELKKVKESLLVRIQEQSESQERKENAKKASFFLEEQVEAQNFVLDLKNSNTSLKESLKTQEAFIAQLAQHSNLQESLREEILRFQNDQSQILSNKQATQQSKEVDVFSELKGRIDFFEKNLLAEKRYSQEMIKKISEQRKQFDEERQEFDKIIKDINTKHLADKKDMESKHNEIISRCTSDLQNRVDKVADLQVLLDERDEEIDRLKQYMSSDQRSMLKKIETLESSIKDITKLYYESQSQGQGWKYDAQVTDKTIQRKNERIREIEEQNSKINDELAATKQELKALDERFQAFRRHFALNLIGGMTSPANSIEKVNRTKNLLAGHLPSPTDEVNENSLQVVEPRLKLHSSDNQFDNNRVNETNSNGDFVIQQLSFSPGPQKVVKPIRGGANKKSISSFPESTFIIKPMQFHKDNEE